MKLLRCFPFVCLSLTFVVAGCREQPAEPEQPTKVMAQKVTSADFAAAVTLTGDVQARIHSDLSFRVGGKIISRSVDVGDHVKANQVLARLDPKDLQNNVDSANAEVQAARARVTQTSAAFVRQQKLLPKGYTSQSEYDSAEAALRSSQSALKAAEAQLANAREQLSYTALVADAAGVITERQAEVGQVVQATVPIFSLARDGDRDAVFNVYESLLLAPGESQAISVSLLDNPNIKATGHVREITPTVSAESGTVQVKIALDSVPDGMELGSAVSATGNVQARPAVELPWSALTKDLHEPAVWLVGADNKVKLQRVTVGRYLTGKIVINEGLESGQSVVVLGGQLLHPGMEVQVVDPAAKKVTP